MWSRADDRVRALSASKIGAGVLVSYANTATSIVCNFIIVPIYLRYIREVDYGVWMTVSAVVTYLGLLNFGIAQATANYFGAAVARDDGAEQKRVLATGFWSYASVVAGALAILFLAGPLLPWHLLFKGSEGLSETTRWVLLLAPTCFLVELPFTLFSACLRSIGRIHLEQSIAIGQGIAKVTVAFAYLAAGGSLPGLIVALSCTNLAVHCAAYLTLRRELPGTSVRVKYFDKRLRRQMAAPSFFFLVLQISGAIGMSADVMVISAKLGAEHVVPYALAQKVMLLAVGAVAATSANYAPSFLRAYSLGAVRQLRALFRKAMLISVAMGSMASLALLAIGPFFIPLWVGEKNYVGFFPLSMMVGFVAIQMVLIPCDSLLTATGNHRSYALFTFWEAMINLTLSILLVSRFGVAGAAMGTVIARLIGAGPIMLWKSLRLVRLPQPDSVPLTATEA